MLGVIDRHLTKTGRPYLVGEKACYADLMFVPWNDIVPILMGPEFESEWKEKMPKCYEWHQRLVAREAVKRAAAAKAEKMKEGH